MIFEKPNLSRWFMIHIPDLVIQVGLGRRNCEEFEIFPPTIQKERWT